MSSHTPQPKSYAIKKGQFHLEMAIELIGVNITFNPNIQTTNKVQKQTFNPKFPDNNSRKC